MHLTLKEIHGLLYFFFNQNGLNDISEKMLTKQGLFIVFISYFYIAGLVSSSLKIISIKQICVGI